MRKTILIVINTLIFAVLISVGVYISRKQEVKNANEGWNEQFALLHNQVQKQKAILNDISTHIKTEYAPAVSTSFEIENFGIGGNTPNNMINNFLPDYIRENSIEIQLTLAYTAVLEHQLIDLAHKAQKVKDSLNHTPSIRPVPLDSIHTISSFGMRIHPFLHKLKLHEGIDYGAMPGTPVYATAAGIVVYSGYDPITGQYVKIEHGYGYTTLYGHLSKRLVTKGDKVQKGQLIGYVGNSGRSQGPHLHYEVRVYGQHVNPVKFIPNPIMPEEKSLHTSRSISYYITR